MAVNSRERKPPLYPSERQRSSLKKRLGVNREKAAKAKQEAVTASKEVRQLRKELAEKEAELGALITQWCPSCGKKVRLEYDGRKEGYVFFCPFCGARIHACIECYMDNADVETITEYEDRMGCLPGAGICEYRERRGDPKV